MEKVLEHTVAYSDIDTNAHANNAMYMQWAMDAVDYALASSTPVKEFTINFNHETKAGDKVEIFRTVVGQENGTHVFIEGRLDTVSAFTVEIVF